jgi:hypothetical protein
MFFMSLKRKREKFRSKQLVGTGIDFIYMYYFRNQDAVDLILKFSLLCEQIGHWPLIKI